MEKLSFRNKKQDSGDHLMEEGGYSHSPNINNSNNTNNNNNNNNSNNKGFSKEEGGMQLTMFSLDLRSLALFRVLAGLMVAVDAVMRSRSLFAHYANLGVWPTNEAINNINAHSFSFHFSNGNIPFQLVLVVVLVLAGLSLMVGYRSKLSSVVVWLLVLSVQNRNVLVNNQGDDLLRMLLFWALFLPLGERYSVDRALFLPLGERYSVDAARENERPSSSTSQLNLSNCHLSLSSMCFIAQIMIMYWVGYLLKTGVEWEDGTAMYYLFSIDQYTTPFGYFVLRFPNFLVLLTKVYLWFELLMPVLIVFPIANASARTTACFTSFGLFFFLNLSLELGMFTYAPVLASLALLPSSFWDKMLPSFYSYLGLEHSKYWTMGGSTTLYYATTGAYPANTKFSLQIANTFLGLTSPILASEKIRKQHNEENENENAVEVSDIGRYLSDNRLQWVAVDGTGKRHTRHRAVLALLSENPITSLVVPILFKMEKVVAFTYNFYAFVLGLPAVLSFTSSAIPSNNNGNAPPYHSHSHSPSHKRRGGLRRVRVSDLVAVGLLLYVLWWNVGTVNSGLMMSSGNQWLGLALRVDQWWSMFAPAPMKDDGWFVIPAKLANGKEVDLMKAGGGPISYEKPTFVSRTFRDHRWRRYLMNLWSGAHQEKRLFYGRYLCRQWNWYGKGSDDKDYLLKTFRIIYLREVTLKDYRVKGPEPVVLWEHQC